MTTEQLLESSGRWSWKAPLWISALMPPPPNPTQDPQPWPSGDQQHLRYNDQIMDEVDGDSCEADDSDGYEDDPLSEEELGDPMEQVQLWVSSVTSRGGHESDPSWVRPHDGKVGAKTRTELIDEQMLAASPAFNPLS
ncbi:hypothetical protein FRB94_013250 [Tulasnella sp. JGI-2019a]|nr:hypothetical protein FRB94_013250 [Tulasnella sp. JGI-2019a]KAG9023605.1 hypothetical protein FRB95_012727 [Tulasnella sp. JGI-2019a]